MKLARRGLDDKSDEALVDNLLATVRPLLLRALRSSVSDDTELEPLDAQIGSRRRNLDAARSGELPAVKYGAKWYVRPADFRRWLESQPRRLRQRASVKLDTNDEYQRRVYELLGVERRRSA